MNAGAQCAPEQKTPRCHSRPGGTDPVPELQADRSGFRTIEGDRLFRGKRGAKMGCLRMLANTGFPKRPKTGKVPFLHEYGTGRG